MTLELLKQLNIVEKCCINDKTRLKVNSHSALQSLRYIEHESEDHKSSEIEQLKLHLQLALAQADQERARTAQKEEQLWVRPDSPGGLWPTQMLCHNKGLQKTT